jgi:hypothetical protein
MEWTRPLTFGLVVLVAAFAVTAAVELGRTMLAMGEVVAAGVSLAFLIVVVAGTVAVGAKNRRWIENPDAYW